MSFKGELDYSLYLVTDKDILNGRDFIKSIEEAIIGGVTVIQLREKKGSTLDFLNIGFEIKELTSKYNIPLIINDRLDIALAIDGDGLHIGQNDMPISIARKLFGNDKIIGVSTSTLEEALNAEKSGADYIGVGAIFPTNTKENTRSVSLEKLEKIKKALTIPVVAIGGINKKNIKSIIDTKVDGVALVSAILGERDIKKATRNLREIII